MNMAVALLPDWYCAEYAESGKVTYWQTVKALVYAPLRSLTESDPAWLEVLSMLSLVQFAAYLRWGVGPPAALHALERIAPDWLWAILAGVILAVQIGSWLRWADSNRWAALAVAGTWWGALSMVIFNGGGFLAVHITMPGLAVLCLAAARQLAIRSNHGNAGG